MTLYEMFSQLEDPRIARCRLHLLGDIIMLVLCGTIAGAQHYHEIASYGHYKQDMLKDNEGFTITICYRSVFNDYWFYEQKYGQKGFGRLTPVDSCVIADSIAFYD